MSRWWFKNEPAFAFATIFKALLTHLGMKLCFLGTGAMVPTKQRNVSSVLLEYQGEFLLFDCGEGTQRQMNLAGYNRAKVSRVLITHWHGDHVSGLIGLIQTVGNVPNPGVLQIIGPRGTKQHMHHLTHSVSFDHRLTLDIVEADGVKPEVVVDEKKYRIVAAAVEHAIPCLAFRFEEKDTRRIDVDKAAARGIKPGPLMGRLQRGQSVEVEGVTVPVDAVTYVQRGRKAGYVMDTSVTDNAIRIAEDVDVLICESTFLSSEHQDKAEAYGHLSAKDAARIAKSANAKKLVITHFSQRYIDNFPLLEEAQAVFENTVAAYDFMELEVVRS